MQENRPIPDQRKEMTSELVPQFIRASREASLDPGWTLRGDQNQICVAIPVAVVWWNF